MVYIIMELLQNLENVLNNGDPLVREWFLVKSNYLPLTLCLGYVIMVLTGPYLMRNRKPFNLRKTMIVFNFSLVFTYTLTLLYIAHYLQQISWEKFCREMNLVEGEPTYILGCCAWIIYILKYFEFLDTLFFILRRKENLISFLHVLHHTAVPLIGWFLLRSEKNGMQSIPVIVNSFVHVIMYSYYGLAAMGPSVRKFLWWKKYLTQLQMVQFIIIVLFVATVNLITGCPTVASSCILNITFSIFFLVLFYRFYQANFYPSVKKID